MAAFCGSCGKPLESGTRFCPFCGADSGVPVHAPVSAPVAAPSAAPAGTFPNAGGAPQKKSSHVLLTVLVICLVVFGGFAAVLIYAAYWAKNKAITTAKDYGIELPSDTHAHKGRSSAAARRDPCSFLKPAEMAEVTGIAITEQHTEDRTCNFASPDGTGAGAILEFEWGDGRILMTATKAGGKLMTMAPGTELQAVVDVGDEAYFQNGMLTVRKGEDGFRLMMPAELLTKNLGSGNRNVLDNITQMRDMEKTLAQKVLSRM
jgi:hypothetical protein